MQRRTFLQAAAAATASFVISRRGRAQGSTLAPLFISIEANQAWDTTTSIDPTGDQSFSLYRNNQIIEVGGLRVAPFDPDTGAPFEVRKLNAGGGASTVDFFQTYGGFLRVVNGIDHRTVSHDIGPRHAFSGTLREGFPCIGAITAAVQGPNRPLAFLSTGGFDDTQGIVTLTRSGRQNLIRELARPNTSAGLSTNPTFFTPGVDRLIQTNQASRDARRASLLRARGALSKSLRSHDAMIAARGAQDGFLDLANVLDNSPATNDANALIAAAGLVLAAMRSDPASCSSAHLSFGNFDTHVDHDDPVTGHRARMRDLLEGVGNLIEEIENNPANQALKDRGVLIYVSSDFGRTAYNGGDDDGARGKDHWPVTSSILIGLGAMRSQVGGGTTIGRTSPVIDGQVQPGMRAFRSRIDANGNLQTAANVTDSGGDLFALTATEVNEALRHALRLNEEEAAVGTLKLVERFALPEVEPRWTSILAEGRNPLLKDV
jgi:hypothetical protein